MASLDKMIFRLFLKPLALEGLSVLTFILLGVWIPLQLSDSSILAPLGQMAFNAALPVAGAIFLASLGMAAIRIWQFRQWQVGKGSFCHRCSGMVEEEIYASVRFAILLGCGGGSGGGGSGIRARGKQGVGAPVLTTIVGPLEEPRYQIEIGDGGTGGISWRRTEPGNDGENGRETSFESSVGAHPIKINFPGASMAAPIWNQVLNLSRGAEGGPGQPQMIDAHMHPGGFGGLPGIGDGGHGSPANVAGGTGGSCAGGAAAGELSQPDMGVPYGGHGGAGYLMIVPLVDASIVEQRFQSILLELAEASKAAHP